MADGDLLTEYYPITPYNFDVPPNPYLIGPIKSILTVVETKIIQLYADITTVQAMVTVQTATGNYLDAHGVLYATPRLPGEPDSAYRTRILEAITRGKLTIAAIQAVVNNYLASTTSSGGVAPVGLVYDLRSNPGLCATDATNGYPIEIGDFVIQITRALDEDDAWFQNYAYLDYTTFLTTGGTTYQTNIDPELQLLVEQTQAGGTNAVYKNVLTFTT